MRSIRAWLATAVITATTAASAAEVDAPATIDAESEKAAAAVTRLQAVRPDLPIARIESTPIADLYAVELRGGGMLYASADGRYLIAGDMYQITDSELVNLAERKRDSIRQGLMAELDPKDMVVFAPKGDVKAVVNVFTDVDCGFCQKLHREMADYNAAGIEVRYLAYPRAGIGSESYDKIVSAWCSSDPRDSITRLKRGETIPEKTCPNPVANQYNLGRTVGITGTPAIITQNGRLMPGYLPAADLAERLGI